MKKNEEIKKSSFSLFFSIFENIASLFFFDCKISVIKKYFSYRRQNILQHQKFLWAPIFTKRSWRSSTKKPTFDQSFLSRMRISFLLGTESRPWKFGFWMVNRPQRLYLSFGVSRRHSGTWGRQQLANGQQLLGFRLQ